MTKKELNRDVKRLYNEYVHFTFQDSETFNKWAEEKCKPELRRLYGADKEFYYFTLDNLKRMIKMNLRLVVIPLHQFGLFIEL